MIELITSGGADVVNVGLNGEFSVLIPTPGIDFVLSTSSVAFSADGTTSHRDRIFSVGTNSDHVDAVDRCGFELVLEYEPTNQGTNRTVTGATNATPIVVTVAEPIATLANGDTVFVEGVLGNTAANGYFKVKNKNDGARTFELHRRTIGGADVAVAGNGAYTSGGQVVDRLALEGYFACQAPGTNTQNRPISMSYNLDGDFKAQVGLSGAFNLYDTSGTVVHVSIPDGSGALTATLGATGTSISFSSVEKIDIQAGAASVWKTAAGALTLDSGSPGGIIFKRGNNTYADIGVTDSTVTIAANISLAGAAGTGALSLGSMTGATALPTGNLTWTGANTKVCGLTANGAGGDITLTSNGGGLSGTCGGALLLSAGSTGSLQSVGNMSICTGANARTIDFGTGNAIQTINVGTHATPANVIKIAGAASQLGFYGATPVAKQTGVAVTAAAVHAALVNLGLIAA